jgi:hypothetical protein
MTGNAKGTNNVVINAPDNNWVNYIGNPGPYGVPYGGSTCFTVTLQAYLNAYSTSIVSPANSNAFKVCIEECKVTSFVPVT